MSTKALVGLTLGLVLLAGAHAQSYRKEVLKAAQSAQESIKANQPAESLAPLASARALADLNDDEKLLLDRLSAVAGLQSQNAQAAMVAIESLLGNPKLPVAERPRFVSSLASAAVKAKDYGKAERAARECLQLGCAADQMRLMLLQVMSIQGHHADVVKEGLAALADPAQAGSVTEEQLRVVAASQQAVKDQAGYVRTLIALIERNPTRDYWGDLLLRLPSQPGFNPRLELDVYRLMLDTDNLQEASEYQEMANLAIKAGLPIEAAYVYEQAQAKGLLKDAASQKAILQTQKKAQEDQQFLARSGQGAADVQGWAQLGLVRFSDRRWAAAAEAFGKALASADLKRIDEVRLHQGIALGKAGHQPLARDVLTKVGGDAALIAHLWILKLKD